MKIHSSSISSQGHLNALFKDKTNLYKNLRFKFLEEIPEKENLVLVLMNTFLWGLKFRLLYNMLYLCRSKKKN